MLENIKFGVNEEEKKWSFTDSKAFLKQLKEIGKFKEGKDCLNGRFAAKGFAGKVLSREASCVQFGRNLVRRYLSKNNNRKENDLSVISSCSGSGKTVLLPYLFDYFAGVNKNARQRNINNNSNSNSNSNVERKNENLSRFMKDVENDEYSVLKRKFADSFDRVESLSDMIGIYVTYEGENVSKWDSITVELGNREDPVFFVPALLWRIMFEIMDVSEKTWKGFLNFVFENYSNSSDISEDAITGIFKEQFPQKPILLLVDEVLRAPNPEAVCHTVGALLSSTDEIFVDAVISTLIKTGLAKSESGRCYNFIDCKLLDLGDVIDAFEAKFKEKKFAKTKELDELKGKVVNTMGLPQLVKLLYDSCCEKDNESEILTEYRTRMQLYLESKKSYGTKFGFAFISRLLDKHQAGTEIENEVIANNELGITYGQFARSGFIKLDADGVKIAPEILLHICDEEECRDIKAVLTQALRSDINYTKGEQFEKLVICQEKLLGILYDDDYPPFSVQEHFRLDNNHISKQFSGNKMAAKRFDENEETYNYFVSGKSSALSKEDWGKIHKKWTITQLQNSKHRAVDFMEVREDRSRRWVFQVKDETESRGTTAKEIFDKFIETLNACIKIDKRYGNFNYILVIATMSRRPEKFVELFDVNTYTKCIVLHNEDLLNYLFPIFRYRAFNIARAVKQYSKCNNGNMIIDEKLDDSNIEKKKRKTKRKRKRKRR